MSNELVDDEALFSGFHVLVPAVERSLRAVEQTRRLLLLEPMATPSRWARPARRPARRLHVVLQCGLAASLIIVAILGGRYLATRAPNNGNRHAPIARAPRAEGPPVTAPTPPSTSPSTGQTVSPESSRDMAAWAIPNVHALVAERAPVIVANGGAEPVRLGARTKGGGVLHVWDWSKGSTSRVLKEVYWGTESAAISPDGKNLIRAGGDVLELETGKRSQIDLGGADVKVDGRIFGRIGQMRFSPDGGRLAMLVTNLDKEIPGRILSDVVQIVDFPSGRKLCEFPAGEAYALRIGFSNDGRQVAAADTGRHVKLRDIATGEVRGRYEPAMTSQVMDVAISPDGKLVAAVQRDPADLCLWEADSGKLVDRLSGEELQKLGGTAPFYGVLRFSPDGKHLAASYWGRIFVVDTSTFTVAATLKEAAAVEVQWSADGQTLSAILPVIVGDHTAEEHYDLCPTVHMWDWHSAHPPRRLEAKSE